MTTCFVGVNDLGVRVGQDHQNAVLTDREVELMQQLRAEGWFYRQLAEKFEVSRGCVVKVCNGTRRNQRAVEWKRVKVRPALADRRGAQLPAGVDDAGGALATPPVSPP